MGEAGKLQIMRAIQNYVIGRQLEWLDTLAMADEKGGYCLSDRGTWLAKKADFPDMDMYVKAARNVLNQYGVIAVNPEKYPDVNNEAANTFIKWICSPEIQTLIGEYGVKEYGEPLFFRMQSRSKILPDDMW